MWKTFFILLAVGLVVWFVVNNYQATGTSTLYTDKL